VGSVVPPEQLAAADRSPQESAVIISTRQRWAPVALSSFTTAKSDDAPTFVISPTTTTSPAASIATATACACGAIGSFPGTAQRHGPVPSAPEIFSTVGYPVPTGPRPGALARKYPNADREWGWQWVFPAARLSVDHRSGERRRHRRREDSTEGSARGTLR
jgi:hypothetical protein